MNADILKFIDFFNKLLLIPAGDSEQIEVSEIEIHCSSYEEDFMLDYSIIDLIQTFKENIQPNLFEKLEKKAISIKKDLKIKISYPGLIDCTCFKKMITSIKDK